MRLRLLQGQLNPRQAAFSAGCPLRESARIAAALRWAYASVGPSASSRSAVTAASA